MFRALVSYLKMQMKLRFSPSKSIYCSIMPLWLLLLSLVVFVAAALIQEPWTHGWVATTDLLLLSFATLFVPYVLLPLALWIPTRLPWVKDDIKSEFSIDGKGRLAQRIIVFSLIGLPGLTVLSAYDGGTLTRSFSFVHLASLLLIASKGPVMIFAIVTIALGIPNIDKRADDLD